MKAYIFVTHGMSGIGGGQRYVLSKAKWLVENGWEVCICHVAHGDIILDCSMARLIDIPELRAHPKTLGKKRTQEIVDSVLAQYKGADEVYVESSAPYLGMWGEEIARAAHGRHLCYALEEAPTPEDRGFLEFKRGRHELAFIKNTVAAATFGDDLSNATSYDDCVLTAYNPSPIEDISFDGKTIKGDFTIGCISRLDKPAVMLMMEGLGEFCDAHHDVSIALVFIGDTPYEQVKTNIEAYGQTRDNLGIQILGYMSPIPLGLVSRFDFCIGKAGAAMITSELGIPTIWYSIEDELAGFSHYEKVDGEYKLVLPSNDEGKTLPQLLEETFLQGGLKRMEGQDAPGLLQRHIDYSDHLAFIPESNAYDYYDVQSAPVTWQRRLVSLWLKLFKNTDYEAPLVALREHFGKQS